MELPFEITKRHKAETKNRWKQQELSFTPEEFEILYYRYIYLTHCELPLCNKEFKDSKDRHMDHNHKTGEFRNFICSTCNKRRYDNKIRKDNTSGYKGICKHFDKSCKQGFYWRFRVSTDGKTKTIKTSVDFDKLVEFANKWKIENNYNT